MTIGQPTGCRPGTEGARPADDLAGKVRKPTYEAVPFVQPSGKITDESGRVVKADKNLLYYWREASTKLRYSLRREIDYHRVRPRDALLFLTYRCTSRCQTCTMWERRDKEGELTLDEWKHAIDELHDVGVRYIELFGGDALLRKDVLVPLVEYTKTQYPSMLVDLVTNSNLMDEETARGLVETGVDDLWVSMDGVGESHDEVRGRDGTFGRLKSCLDWLLDAKGDGDCPHIHANCTISNLNYDSFDRVLEYAVERGLEWVHFEYVGEFWDQSLDKSTVDGIRPMPYFIKQGDTVLCNREQSLEIKRRIAALRQRAADNDYPIRVQTENIDRLTVDNMVTGKFDNRRCYITRFKVTVDPKGYIIGCPFFGEWKMGKVTETRLREIWGNESHRRFMRAFKDGSFRFCDYCILGVQRNPTMFQDLRDTVNSARGRARM